MIASVNEQIMLFKKVISYSFLLTDMHIVKLFRNALFFLFARRRLFLLLPSADEAAAAPFIRFVELLFTDFGM
jgi:hypothetical protein